MFKKKDIDKALNRLFDLFDAESMGIIMENYDEELEDISPSLLARHFEENAGKVYEYRVMGNVGEEIDYFGKAVFEQRAVNLMVCVKNLDETNNCRILRTSELWLLEDMTFVKVNYYGTAFLDGEKPICVTEYRYFDKEVETSDDIFFEPYELVCSLDDMCMFAQLLPKATSDKR